MVFNATSNAILVAAVLGSAGLGIVLIFLSDNDRNRGIAAEAAATALYLILVVLRAPTLLSFYRIWAETAGLYFYHAYSFGPLSGLLNTSSNYYDLSANMASALAVLAGLQWWPTVDTGLGLACAAALPFTLWGLKFSAGQRVAIMLAVSTAFFCVTGSETFGTVLHNKAWGAVYAAIVLASIAVNPDSNKVRNALLVVLPFTGTVAVFAFLTWVAATAILRLRTLLKPIIWTLPGMIVQVVCAVLPPEHTGLAVRPLSLSTMIYIPDLFAVKTIGAMFFPGLFFRAAVPGTLEILVSAALSVAIVLAAFYAAHRRQHLALLLLVAMGVFYGSAALAVGGAGALLQGGSSYRYYFAPVAIVLAASALSCLRFGLPARVAFASICLFIVVSNHSYNMMVASLFFEPGEWDWSSQAKAHLSSPNELIKKYPPGSAVRLPDCGEYYCR